MADNISIVAEPREVVGKKVKALRREGLVPGVVYGQSDPVNVQMERKALRRALRIVGTSQLADLEVDGNVRRVLVREIQQHLTRGDVLHVDFMEVDAKSEITSEAAIVLIGEAKVDIPGSVIQVSQSVNISCLPDDLVSEIEVDISSIQSTSDLIYLSDVKAPEGVTLTDDPEMLIARFQTEALETEEEEGDYFAADAVEVIGRDSEDEDA
ncbi:MAG: 50S ribosomal protein L25 [Chloroflexota bacterium]